MTELKEYRLRMARSWKSPFRPSLYEFEEKSPNPREGWRSVGCLSLVKADRLLTQKWGLHPTEATNVLVRASDAFDRGETAWFYIEASVATDEDQG